MLAYAIDGLSRFGTLPSGETTHVAPWRADGRAVGSGNDEMAEHDPIWS